MLVGDKKTGRHKSFQINALCLAPLASNTKNGAVAHPKNRQFSPIFSARFKNASFRVALQCRLSRSERTCVRGVNDDYEDAADVAPPSLDFNVSNEGNEDPTHFPSHFREKMSLDRKFVGSPATRRGLSHKT
jgi:hypothetical protein